ncbi:MAG: 2-C-methyl-D-erythritol 2,4-cyclodiphosphate synthase [Zoogloeaceae bacterium]|jgi:2-C-methyl-D-erythritol 2,4-cyclodiphosphate synthase|nr:2-C-methyl-D-erythritol 2,4-cyclodiphosphate synthase [Zoogloeaceae bacterium]
MPETEYRIGQGYDVHALVTGRKLILGGVEIPFAKGLLGHSDADALLHAVTDALLGAAGLGDIGTHFPDSDPAHRDADSRRLLRETLQKIRARGWQPVNVDATIIAQAPRLAPHIPAMRAVLASDLDLPEEAVNIKGKSNENLGYLGRGEAIEAQAAVLLARLAGFARKGEGSD